MHYGWSALYGLYRTAEGWLCIAVLTEAAWSILCETLGRSDLTTDARFASPDSRRDNDPALRTELDAVFAQRSAADWFKILDAAEIPCEVSSTDFVHELFDTEEWREKGWVTSYQHSAVGRMDVFGLLFDLDETPGRIAGPPPLVGEHTHELLAEAGYTTDQVAELLAQKAAFDLSGAARP
jgi:crotonobetainyl-CoA:carnitine CoA-transferase CaiB-like acyl-CoA transferase